MELGQKIKFKSYDVIREALFLREINFKDYYNNNNIMIEVILIDNRLTRGVKTIIYKNQIIE